MWFQVHQTGLLKFGSESDSLVLLFKNNNNNNNNRSYLASQWVLVIKNLSASIGDITDAGLIPESERSPGEGPGNPL